MKINADRQSNWTRYGYLYFVALLCLYALAVLCFRHPPYLQDYPTWVYEGTLYAQALTGHANPAFLVKRFPVPNMLSDLGLAALSLLFGWVWAAKVWVLAYLLVCACAVRRMAKTRPQAATLLYWMSPTLFIVGLPFWYGFLNFNFGLALLLYLLAELEQQQPSMGKLTVFLTLAFMAHAVPFLVCSLLLLVFAATQKRLRMLVVFAPSLLLGLWYVYGRFVLTGDPEKEIPADTIVPYGSLSFLVYKANTFFKLLGYVNPVLPHKQLTAVTFGHIGMLVLLLLSAGVGVIFLTSAIVRFIGFWRGDRTARLHWIPILLLVVAALLSPSALLGVSDPGARFLTCAFVLLLLHLPSREKTAPLLISGSALLGLAGITLFFALAREPIPGKTEKAALPTGAAKFAHVEPLSRSRYYLELQQNEWKEPVFQTALLLNRQHSGQSY